MTTFDPERGNVLLVTDDPDEGARLRRWVESAGERPVLLAGSESALIATGIDDSVDVVVTDLDTDSPAVRRLIERMVDGTVFPGVPQIHIARDLAFLQALGRRAPAIAAVALTRPVEAGAFRARVRLAAEVGRLRRERRRSSIRDELTGLANRRYVLGRLDQEYSRARRYRTPLSLIAIDIDGLRRVNRRWDESVGDRVLKATAEILSVQCRKEDLVGRVGEDSFAFVLPGTPYRGAAVLANKLRTEVEGLALDVEGEPLEVRTSAGISSVPGNAGVTSGDELLALADGALAEAKRRGGNRVHIDSGVIRRDAHLVLVADADRDLLDLAEDFLAMDDYRVVRAENVSALLEAMRFRVPDLLVLDLDMEMEGGGGDGAVLEAVRDRLGGRSCPIVGLCREPGTGRPDAAGVGVDRILTKPFSVSLLRHLARELVDEAPHGQDLAQWDRGDGPGAPS